jgi:cobalt/nickel transport protein
MKDQFSKSSTKLDRQPLVMKKLQNWLLIGGVVSLALLPLFIVKDGKFGGADDQGKEAITVIKPDYKPWFASLIQPASGEIAGLLFAAQAAMGAGVVGYAIGWYKGNHESRNSERE